MDAQEEISEPETPAVFLLALGELLRKEQWADIGLVDILAEHLLTVTPTKDAVAQAKTPS